MHEIEIKILEVDGNSVAEKLEQLEAEKVQETLLVVDWFSLPGLNKDNQPWYLRVRSYDGGKVEITWKDKHKALGIARKVEEVNLLVDSHEKTKLLFEAIGLFCYAHQEKKRISWKIGGTQFDMDTYPRMPAYLEIEAPSGEVIAGFRKKRNME